MSWRKQQAFNSAAPRGLRNVERPNPPNPPFLERCINVRTLKRFGLRCCLAFSATVVQPGLCCFCFLCFMALLSTVWEVYSHCFYTLVRLGFFKWAEITSWHSYFRQLSIPLLKPMHSIQHPKSCKIQGGIRILGCVYFKQKFMQSTVDTCLSGLYLFGENKLVPLSKQHLGSRQTHYRWNYKLIKYNFQRCKDQ